MTPITTKEIVIVEPIRIPPPSEDPLKVPLIGPCEILPVLHIPLSVLLFEQLNPRPTSVEERPTIQRTE